MQRVNFLAGENYFGRELRINRADDGRAAMSWTAVRRARASASNLIWLWRGGASPPLPGCALPPLILTACGTRAGTGVCIAAAATAAGRAAARAAVSCRAIFSAAGCAWLFSFRGNRDARGEISLRHADFRSGRSRARRKGRSRDAGCRRLLKLLRRFLVLRRFRFARRA